MQKMNQLPDFVLGGAYYLNPPEDYKKKLTFVTQRDETIELFKERDNGTLIIPRNMARISQGVEDRREIGRPIDCTSNFDYDYDPEQKPFIDASVELLGKGISHIAQARTGFGKTFTGSEVACRVGRRFCVITTKDDIVDQWIEAIEQVCGIPRNKIGIWRGDQYPKKDHDAVIALIQSVHKGYDRYPKEVYQDFGLVICDEVHRMGADKFSQAMWYFPALLRYGLSATAHRKDGRQQVFEAHIGEVKVMSTAEEEIPKILVFNTGWKVPVIRQWGNWMKVPHSMGRTMSLCKHMGTDVNRNNMICEFATMALDKGRHTILFTDTVEHLENVYTMLEQRGLTEMHMGFYVGLTAKVYSGNQTNRKKQREESKKKSIIFATYKMASEATNIPSLDTAILGTPRADVEQIVGRIRRTHPGKRPPVVFDMYDPDSQVLRNYYKGRSNWYNKLGCEVVEYN